MLRSDLTIAGSNFIFKHIQDNYSKYLNLKNRLLVIFRGINVDYFDPTTKLESEEDQLIKSWGIIKKEKNNSIAWKINFLERPRAIYRSY